MSAGSPAPVGSSRSRSLLETGPLKRGVATQDETVDGGGPAIPAASSPDGPIILSPAMRVAMSSSVMILFNMIRSSSGA
eukprot:9265475-Alexandrium_andersonii.AAC.1